MTPNESLRVILALEWLMCYLLRQNYMFIYKISVTNMEVYTLDNGFMPLKAAWIYTFRLTIDLEYFE